MTSVIGLDLYSPNHILANSRGISAGQFVLWLRVMDACIDMY